MCFKKQRLARLRREAMAELEARKAVEQMHKPVGKAQLIFEWVKRSHPMRAYTHLMLLNGTLLAAGMSFHALFAVFAGLFIGFAIFGQLLASNPELLATIVAQLDTMVPGLFGKGGAVDLETLLSTSVIGWTGAIAVVSLLFVTVAWFTNTRNAIRMIFMLDTREYGNPVVLKLRDTGLALFFGVMLVISAGLIVLSSSATNALFVFLGVGEDSWLLNSVVSVFGYIVMFAFDVLIIFLIHRVLAKVQGYTKDILLGSVLGAAGFLVIKLLGSALLGGATKNPLLASFAVLIGLLIWFNLLCTVLLLASSWIATRINTQLGMPPSERDDSVLIAEEHRETQLTDIELEYLEKVRRYAAIRKYRREVR